MIRLFVALTLPETIRQQLALVRAPIADARWVPPENMHVTLRFIGEVEPPVAEEIDAELARIDAPAFDLRLTELGTFSSRGRVRIFWAGAERTEPLLALQAKIEAACLRVGLEPERRKYHPHTTLARCKNAPEEPVNAFIASHPGFDFPAVPADSFTLFSSRTGKAGAVYVAEAVYPLGR